MSLFAPGTLYRDLIKMINRYRFYPEVRCGGRKDQDVASASPEVSGKQQLESYELIELHKLIEDFYKHCK